MDETTEVARPTPAGHRLRLPLLGLLGALAAVGVTAGLATAAVDARQDAERDERRALTVLERRDEEAKASVQELSEAVDPAERFVALAGRARDAAQEATRLDTEEMMLNRTQVQVGLLGDIDNYNDVVDQANALRPDQYELALRVYDLMNRLRSSSL